MVFDSEGNLCGATQTGSRKLKNDPRRFSPIPHRIRAATQTHTRPRRVVVGRQGRLDAGARIRSAGRRQGRSGSVSQELYSGRSNSRAQIVPTRNWSPSTAALMAAYATGERFSRREHDRLVAAAGRNPYGFAFRGTRKMVFLDTMG